MHIHYCIIKDVLTCKQSVVAGDMRAAQTGRKTGRQTGQTDWQTGICK